MSLPIDYGGGQRNSFANPATCRHYWAVGWQKPHEVKPVKVGSRPFGLYSHLPPVTFSVSWLRLDSLTPAHRGVRGAMTISRARAVALLVGPSQVGSVLLRPDYYGSRLPRIAALPRPAERGHSYPEVIDRNLQPPPGLDDS